MIDRLIPKLDMLGAIVVAHNDFGVVYKLNGAYTLIKYTYSNSSDEIINRDKISGFIHFTVGKYFIQVFYRGRKNNCGLYIKYLRTNLVSNHKTIYTNSNSDCAVYIGTTEKEAKLLIYETSNGKIVIMNLLGDKMDATSYGAAKLLRATLALQKLDENNYRFGSCISSIIDEPSLNAWFFDIDISLKNIRFNKYS